MQKCMDMITADDVIRAIGRYYDGGRYKIDALPPEICQDFPRRFQKVRASSHEINLLASLQSSGGGEQSAVAIAEILRAAGWIVNFHPWDRVDKKFATLELLGSFKSGAAIKPDIPLQNLRPYIV